MATRDAEPLQPPAGKLGAGRKGSVVDQLGSFLRQLPSEQSAKLKAHVDCLAEGDPLRSVVERAFAAARTDVAATEAVPANSVLSAPTPNPFENRAFRQRILEPLNDFVAGDDFAPEIVWALPARLPPEFVDVLMGGFHDGSHPGALPAVPNSRAGLHGAGDAGDPAANLRFLSTSNGLDQIRRELGRRLANQIAVIEKQRAPPNALQVILGSGFTLQHLKNVSNILQINGDLARFRSRLPAEITRIDASTAGWINRALMAMRRQNRILFAYCAVIVFRRLRTCSLAPMIPGLQRDFAGSKAANRHASAIFVEFALARHGMLARVIQDIPHDADGSRKCHAVFKRFMRVDQSLVSFGSVETVPVWFDQLKAGRAVVGDALGFHIDALLPVLRTCLYSISVGHDPVAGESALDMKGDPSDVNRTKAMAGSLPIADACAKISLSRALQSQIEGFSIHRKLATILVDAERAILVAIDGLMAEGGQSKKLGDEQFRRGCSALVALTAALFGSKFSKLLLKRLQVARVVPNVSQRRDAKVSEAG